METWTWQAKILDRLTGEIAVTAYVLDTPVIRAAVDEVLADINVGYVLIGIERIDI